MWSEIATGGWSRFITLIKRSDFPSVPSLPGGRCTADDIPCKKTLGTFTQLTEDICDFGVNLPDSGKQGYSSQLLHPGAPQLPPGGQPPTTDTISTLSARAKENISCSIKCESQQEMKESWPGRQIKKAGEEKSTAERESTLHLLGLWVHGETNFCLLSCACVCIIATGSKWNSAASIKGDVFFLFSPPSNSVKLKILSFFLGQ